MITVGVSEIREYTVELSKKLNIPVQYLDSAILEAVSKYNASNSIINDSYLKELYTSK